MAECQHMTRAAETLHMAQSAASSAIAALESRHAVRLFHRVGRRIELTDTGTLFLPEARAVLARAQSAELMLVETGGLLRGCLPVQASQTVGSYWLPRHIVAFRHLYPRIDLRLGIGNTAQVAGAVRAGTAELGFVEGLVADPALDSAVVAHDQLVLVVGDSHPWVGRDALSRRDLAGADWMLRERGSGTRATLEAALGRLGIAPDTLLRSLELPSNEAVRAAVEAGAGATVISASVAAPSLEAGLLHQVPMDLPVREFRALHHRERHPSRAAEALLAVMGAALPPAIPVADRRILELSSTNITCAKSL